jgi:hypothetical protein
MPQPGGEVKTAAMDLGGLGWGTVPCTWELVEVEVTSPRLLLVTILEVCTGAILVVAGLEPVMEIDTAVLLGDCGGEPPTCPRLTVCPGTRV